MNNLKPTLTAQDIVLHICADFMFPVTNQSGVESLALSRDAGSVGAIQSMVQVHDFVEQNAKFEQPAVKFETTIYGRRWLGYSRAGENLYPIVLSPTTFCPLPRQQLSEALSLWQEVLPQILGTHALFLGDPFRSMNDQGVTERPDDVGVFQCAGLVEFQGFGGRLFAVGVFQGDAAGWVIAQS